MQVHFFDPESGKWEKGPNLPGAGLAGFGVSAWNLDGQLYVCGLRGVLYRLNDAGSAWEEAGRLETPRFFHQLVPGSHGGLLAVGGARWTVTWRRPSGSKSGTRTQQRTDWQVGRARTSAPHAKVRLALRFMRLNRYPHTIGSMEIKTIATSTSSKLSFTIWRLPKK